ncbi:hypothetical protein F4778DRAFT_793598 [Xylariomycetidae sp. FL2044]|nr:hypothetical protein F4778DRAFT_793598 [Xylariomycetidae sp. FL2044]
MSQSDVDQMVEGRMITSNRPFPFLRLPPEIRLEVYRILLKGILIYKRRDLIDGWVLDGWGEFNERMIWSMVYPEILQTCSQIFREARPVLYGENVWTFEFDGPDVWIECCNHREEIPNTFPSESRIKAMRNLRLVVKPHYWDDELMQIETIDSIIDWSIKLSTIPKLDHVHIQLDTQPPPQSELMPVHYQLLRGFSLLRAGKVDIEYVPSEYAKDLISVMEGTDPVDPLPMMYQALRQNTQRHGFLADLVRQAAHTVGCGNINEFNTLRKTIIQRVDKHIADLISLKSDLSDISSSQDVEGIDIEVDGPREV